MKFIKNNIANILSLSRLVLLPAMIALFFAESAWGAFAIWLCLIIYIIACITDFLDGYIARKLNQISDFGIFIDPISDKVFVSTLFILLIAFGKISGLWIILVIIIFAREFLISGLREFLGPKDIKMPVSYMAKWKTSTQMLSLGFLIIGNDNAPYTTDLGLILLSIATILTVMTAISYLIAAVAYLREESES